MAAAAGPAAYVLACSQSKEVGAIKPVPLARWTQTLRAHFPSQSNCVLILPAVGVMPEADCLLVHADSSPGHARLAEVWRDGFLARLNPENEPYESRARTLEKLVTSADPRLNLCVLLEIVPDKVVTYLPLAEWTSQHIPSSAYLHANIRPMPPLKQLPVQTCGSACLEHIAPSVVTVSDGVLLERELNSQNIKSCKNGISVFYCHQTPVSFEEEPVPGAYYWVRSRNTRLTHKERMARPLLLYDAHPAVEMLVETMTGHRLTAPEVVFLLQGLLQALPLFGKSRASISLGSRPPHEETLAEQLSRDYDTAEVLVQYEAGQLVTYFPAKTAPERRCNTQLLQNVAETCVVTVERNVQMVVREAAAAAAAAAEEPPSSAPSVSDMQDICTGNKHIALHSSLEFALGSPQQQLAQHLLERRLWKSKNMVRLTLTVALPTIDTPILHETAVTVALAMFRNKSSNVKLRLGRIRGSEALYDAVVKVVGNGAAFLCTAAAEEASVYHNLIHSRNQDSTSQLPDRSLAMTGLSTLAGYITDLSFYLASDGWASVANLELELGLLNPGTAPQPSATNGLRTDAHSAQLYKDKLAYRLGLAAFDPSNTKTPLPRAVTAAEVQKLAAKGAYPRVAGQLLVNAWPTQPTAPPLSFIEAKTEAEQTLARKGAELAVITSRRRIPAAAAAAAAAVEEVEEALAAAYAHSVEARQLLNDLADLRIAQCRQLLYELSDVKDLMNANFETEVKKGEKRGRYVPALLAAKEARQEALDALQAQTSNAVGQLLALKSFFSSRERLKRLRDRERKRRLEFEQVWERVRKGEREPRGARQELAQRQKYNTEKLQLQQQLAAADPARFAPLLLQPPSYGKHVYDVIDGHGRLGTFSGEDASLPVPEDDVLCFLAAPPLLVKSIQCSGVFASGATPGWTLQIVWPGATSAFLNQIVNRRLVVVRTTQSVSEVTVQGSCLQVTGVLNDTAEWDAPCDVVSVVMALVSETKRFGGWYWVEPSPNDALRVQIPARYLVDALLAEELSAHEFPDILQAAAEERNVLCQWSAYEAAAQVVRFAFGFGVCGQTWHSNVLDSYVADIGGARMLLAKLGPAYLVSVKHRFTYIFEEVLPGSSLYYDWTRFVPISFSNRVRMPSREVFRCFDAAGNVYFLLKGVAKLFSAVAERHRQEGDTFSVNMTKEAAARAIQKEYMLLVEPAPVGSEEGRRRRDAQQVE